MTKPAQPPPDVGKLVRCASRDLQAIETALANRDCKCDIRFPREFIRTAQTFRDRWWFIQSDVLRRNVAYLLILSDVNRWMLNRMGLLGVAREMVVKQGIFVIAAVLEGVTIDFLGARKGGFDKRVQKLRDAPIIDEALANRLKKVWKDRNEMHIQELQTRAMGKHKLADYNNAIHALRGLREQLDAASRSSGRKPPPFS
jgi:hypothetical protein